MYRILDAFHAALGVEGVIEGEAPGADLMSRAWAEARQIPFKPYPAEWERYRPTTPGRKNPAGAIRNRQMLREGKPEYVLAFHRRPEVSRGSADMMAIARASGLQTWWVPFELAPPWWWSAPSTGEERIHV